MTKDVNVFNPNTSLPAKQAGVFNSDALAGDLSDGAGGGGFQLLSIRGSKWRVKTSAGDLPILNADDEPTPSIEVILVKSNKNISKLFYEKSYSEGDDEAPTCMSVDGVKPDTASTKPQNKDCATCANNKWGSRITEAGKKAKRCADTRRIAVWLRTMEPVGADGSEPMLLRIPAASLNDLATFGANMAKKQYPYNAIVTRIGFDVHVSFPKLTFRAVRPITEDEAATVVTMFSSDTVGNILSQQVAPVPVEEEEGAAAEPEEPAPDDPTEFEAPATPAPVRKKAASKKAAKTKAKASLAADDDDGMGDALDSIINDLENLGA